MVWFTQSILEYNMGVLKSMSILSTISKDYSVKAWALVTVCKLETL